MRSRSVAACTALAALLAGAIAAPAAIAGSPPPPPPKPPPPAGEFSCRASAARATLPLLGTIEPVVANPANRPCKTDSKALIPPTNIGNVLTVSVLNANTVATSTSGHADSHVAKATIFGIAGLGVIEVELLTSSADATCDTYGQPAFSSAGNVLNLKIGGSPITIPADGAPVVVNLLVAKLYLNEVVVKPGTSITRRALRLSVPGLLGLGIEVVLAESIADVKGNPCEQKPPPPPPPPPPKDPECSDGKDNDYDKKIDKDDKQCYDKKGKYDPKDDDESK